MKYAEYLCEKCASCRDPKGYCKFRTACIINAIGRQKMKKTPYLDF